MSIDNNVSEWKVPECQILPEMSPKTPEDRIRRVKGAIEKVAGESTPDFTNKVERLVKMPSGEDTICGHKVEITPTKLHIYDEKAGQGATSTVYKMVSIDKETSDTGLYAKLQTYLPPVYENMITLRQHLENSYGDSFVQVQKHLNLQTKINRNENDQITSVDLDYHTSNLNVVNPGLKPLHFYAEELASAAKGLSYLHGAGAVHSDIKLDNILASHGDILCQLADFGFTTINPKPNNGIGGLITLFAPEVYDSIDNMKKNIGTINAETDVYTWGLMMRHLMIDKIFRIYKIDCADAFSSLEHANINPDLRDNYGRIFYDEKSKTFFGFDKDGKYEDAFNNVLKEANLSDEKKAAFRQFIDYSFLCTKPDPGERPTAEQIAEFLLDFALLTEEMTIGRILFDESDDEGPVDASGYAILPED